MEILIGLIVAILFGGGVYLILRRSIMRLIIGIILLSHGVNLMLFASGGMTQRAAPIVGSGAELSTAVADPLPQALILTAIVISFGVLAFTLILVLRSYDTVGTDDLDEFRGTES